MELNATGNSRRDGAYFPSTETGAVDGQREEDVGIPKHVVIEKVSGCRAEIGDIERPARQRNRESELALFVPLPMERQKSAVGSVALRQQRARHGEQWRSLVVASPECARHPVQFRNLQSGAHPRISGVLAERMIASQKRICPGSPEMSQTNATVQGEPSSQLVLIFQKDGRDRAPEFLPLGRDHRSAIPSVDRKQLVVALPENLDSDARGVLISRVGSR